MYCILVYVDIIYTTELCIKYVIYIRYRPIIPRYILCMVLCNCNMYIKWIASDVGNRAYNSTVSGMYYNIVYTVSRCVTRAVARGVDGVEKLPGSSGSYIISIVLYSYYNSSNDTESIHAYLWERVSRAYNNNVQYTHHYIYLPMFILL